MGVDHLGFSDLLYNNWIIDISGSHMYILLSKAKAFEEASKGIQ
jgi:hypothetical protein